MGCELSASEVFVHATSFGREQLSLMRISVARRVDGSRSLHTHPHPVIWDEVGGRTLKAKV
jgi:hypothetical protein